MIHSMGSVSPRAKLGKNVSIGPNTIIHDNVIIGDDTIIEGFCEIGVSTTLSAKKELIIGAKSHIRSHSIFYQGSEFGEDLSTGHRVTVRENTKAGVNLRLGTLCDIQGDCEIGDYVRLHSNVHIGKCSAIHDFVWIFPYVVLTNDPHPPSEVLQGVTLEKFSVVATMSVVLPGVTVGTGALVGAHSLVNKNVKPDAVVVGSPLKHVCNTSEIKNKETGEHVYPWRARFKRGYPEKIVKEWEEEFNE